MKNIKLSSSEMTKIRGGQSDTTTINKPDTTIVLKPQPTPPTSGGGGGPELTIQEESVPL